MLSTLWRIRSFCASLFAGTTRRDTDEGDTGQPPQGLYLERRYETRLPSMKSCQFSFIQSQNPNSMVFQEWAGITVNQSKSGMLLWVDATLPKGQLLEVRTEGTLLNSSVSLVEVQWSKGVRKTSEGQPHLVGCRKTLPTSQYRAS